MDINKKIKSYLNRIFGCGLVLLCGFSCEPSEVPRLSLEFEIPVTTIPAKEIYSLGDTLTIEIKFDKKLIDLHSEFSYEFEEFDFRGALRFNELVDKKIDKSSQPGAMNSIIVSNEIGGLEVVSGSGAELIYFFDGYNYILRSKLILKKPGIYSLSFLTNTNSYGETRFKNSLNVPGYIATIKKIYYKVNEGKITNTHLINEHTSNIIDENEEPNNWHRPFFSFKVIERP